ncbi:unnamed protein product [Closterium sp. NIES-65]|nr:unnamed protein product [Closterium sp. NIES-65]
MSGKCGDDPAVGTTICKPQWGGTCRPSGSFRAPAFVPCDSDNMSECCKPLATYYKYTCSPPVSNVTSAILTLNGFGDGEDGGGESSCDGRFHSNTERVVALSTGWFANRRRCGRQIRISASNGRSVLATVVDECDSQTGSDCCRPLAKYHKYTCSPPVSNATSAILTLNGFGDGQDGGGASSCDGRYHSNSETVVALSTGWFAKRRRCGRQIRISASNGRSVLATVVDECDSRAGCDRMHAGQPPCIINDVDASAAVWQALGIGQSDSRYGYMKVTWQDV